MFKKMVFPILASFMLVVNTGECVSTLSISAHGQIAKANDIDIWYETFGDKENPALLMLMGGCCQGVLWHKTLCEKLAHAGFYVIRYDHRDAGLSSCLDYEKNPYDVMDMTQDAVGVLDAAGVNKAHLFGVSLGSLLSEMMAVFYPERVHTITLMGSTCDIRPMNRALAGLTAEEKAALSSPLPHYVAWMKEFIKLTPHTQEEKLAQRMEGWNRLNGQIKPLDAKINRQIQTEFLLRMRSPQGIVNHIRMLNTPHSEEMVLTVADKIRVPTIIVHGTEDPIFPPDHAEELHSRIENAEFLLVDGMGHVPNQDFYDLYVDVLKKQASQILKKYSGT